MGRGLGLVREYDEHNPPTFSTNEVRFNGPGASGRDTFRVGRQPTCKYDQCETDREPYDVAVCACLVVFSHHFKDKFRVSSDGDDDTEGWVRARAACQEALGYGAEFSLNKRKWEWRFVKAGLPFIQEWVPPTVNDIRRYHYHFKNGWFGVRHSNQSRCEVRDGEGGQHLFVAKSVEHMAMYAAYRFLVETFPDAPGFEEFVVPFRETGEWNALAVWADYLGESGKTREEKLLRQLLPRFVSGSV
jgi:hypothetical protein